MRLPHRGTFQTPAERGRSGILVALFIIVAAQAGFAHATAPRLWSSVTPAAGVVIRSALIGIAPCGVGAVRRRSGTQSIAT